MPRHMATTHSLCVGRSEQIDYTLFEAREMTVWDQDETFWRDNYEVMFSHEAFGRAAEDIDRGPWLSTAMTRVRCSTFAAVLDATPFRSHNEVLKYRCRSLLLSP